MKKELLEVGFVEIGHWSLVNNEIEIILTHQDYANLLKNNAYALYAFCENNTIRYIGKTSSTLKRRFNHYRKGTQLNNRRIREEEIKPILSAGKKIAVLAAVFPSQIKWGRFDINLAAGLEDTLIDQLNPCWNRVGKKQKK
jgi:hypothetical protein